MRRTAFSFVILAMLFAGPTAFADTFGNSDDSQSFTADASYAAYQNLGVGTFATGQYITSVSMYYAIPSSMYNLFQISIREYDSNGNQTASNDGEDYLSVTSNSKTLYTKNFENPILMRSDRCYSILAYTFNSTPGATFYGGADNWVNATTSQCDSGRSSDDIATAV